MDDVTRELYEAAKMLIFNAIAFRDTHVKHSHGADFDRLERAVNAIEAKPADTPHATHGEGPSGGHATGIYARPAE